MKNKVKAVSKAMRGKAEEGPTELKNCPNGIVRQVKGLKIDKIDKLRRNMYGRITCKLSEWDV